MTELSADRAEIGRFVHALFVHADADGYVSLRTFEHQPGAKPFEIRAVQINGDGLEPVVAQATGAANRAAKFERPTVFAPPVCTFRSATRAAEGDLANGLCLAIECDEHPAEACRRLIGLLGGVTAIIASGGEWTDPATGETEPRVHVYVRLREPTRTPEEHGKLKRANRLAAALVGSDPSAVPLVHPLRWAGSVHRKGTPKLCRISDLHDEFEIDLADAEERLEQAARLALDHATGPDADRLRVALDVHETRANTARFRPRRYRPGPRGPRRRDPQCRRAAGRVDQGRAWRSSPRPKARQPDSTRGSAGPASRARGMAGRSRGGRTSPQARRIGPELVRWSNGPGEQYRVSACLAGGRRSRRNRQPNPPPTSPTSAPSSA